MASIVKRNNSYCVVYTYKHADGTQKQKWETFTDLADAKNRKKEVEYAQRFDDFFYQHHGAEPEVLPRAEQSTPKASPVDTDAAAALAKLLADPSMATLIKNLAKNL